MESFYGNKLDDAKVRAKEQEIYYPRTSGQAHGPEWLSRMLLLFIAGMKQLKSSHVAGNSIFSSINFLACQIPFPLVPSQFSKFYDFEMILKNLGVFSIPSLNVVLALCTSQRSKLEFFILSRLILIKLLLSSYEIFGWSGELILDWPVTVQIEEWLSS